MVRYCPESVPNSRSFTQFLAELSSLNLTTIFFFLWVLYQRRDRYEGLIVLLYWLSSTIIVSNVNGMLTASASRPLASNNWLVLIGIRVCAVNMRLMVLVTWATEINNYYLDQVHVMLRDASSMLTGRCYCTVICWSCAWRKNATLLILQWLLIHFSLHIYPVIYPKTSGHISRRNTRR